MNIGATGTEHGATEPQLEKAVSLIAKRIKRYGSARLCQGCCIGFDEQITVAAKERWPDEVFICAHPPLLVAKLSQQAVDLSDRVMPAKDYLSRDRDIVRHGRDWVVGAPEGFRYRTRGSGTWYTLTYAVDHERPSTVVFPDGTIRSGWSALGRGAR